jgi:hypothetical protein
VRSLCTGGAAAYRHLNEQQRQEKQKAAHELGAAANKKQATDLGLALTQGGRGRAGDKADGDAVAFGGEWWLRVHTHTHSMKALLRLCEGSVKAL